MTVPLEAFVMCVFLISTLPFKGGNERHLCQTSFDKNHHIHKTKMLHVDIFRP
ncbi:DUF1196 family protein [Vibrio cholerae]|nr:DUF1196 domain-containing protein [Vibrio cholerae]EGR2840713.1 DUF1196 domain-containing protein [Vibrio cholerae]PAS40085.1 DUF1196 domain-containing protein [Vibrio cholerae]QKU90904.1 DUF1196 family protein [Vibrio cholerae]TXZ96730.1 DUF1196 domain-containing protein [Vibrio cholerae]